ncbi:MAG TPA: M67 family metallopeptidase [Gemmatales bacterium]|nr:M67 family metallopeptidase [Gemmatales bacterium]HMP58801.1 M67 family metallopeptidase [Gemmatales bacterium]
MPTLARPALRLRPEHVAGMVQHARRCQPAECVGLLAGDLDFNVRERFELVNELASPTRFLSEPRSLLAAEKRRRALGLEWLAVYHSHPTTAAQPSRIDLADHWAKSVMCLIISLTSEPPDLRGWWIADGTFQPGLLNVIGE